MFGQDVSLRVEKMVDVPRDLVLNFDCGTSNINSLIFMDTKEDHTVSYLYIDNDTNSLVAYVSIACSGIIVETTEYDGYDVGIMSDPSIMSSIEVEYFAIDQKYQKIPFEPNSDRRETLSFYIFMNVLDLIKDISKNVVGARSIVLYSVPNAMHFYEKCGFARLPSDMTGRTDQFVEECIPMYMFI